MTLVAPTVPGGAPDLLGRVLASRLSELLGQPVIVENIGGAGGMIGAARVAKAPADGYHFLIGTVGSQAQNQTIYKSPLYDAATDFAAVAMLWEIRYLLIVRKDLPVNDLQEFIAYARTNQASMHYGSGGVGGPLHLACALFNAAAGLNVTHVPYRGGTLATQDLLAGRIDYMCTSAASVTGYIEAKQLKALALLSKNRSSLMPAYATAHEQGLREFEVTGWSGLFLPKGTPAPIVNKLNAAVVGALNTPSLQARVQEAGAEIVAHDRRSPEYLQQFVETEIKKWAAVIKAAGLAGQ